MYTAPMNAYPRNCFLKGYLIRSHTSSCRCNFCFFFIAGEHFPNVEDCGHRTLVDFLDLLWSPLKKVESYSQLCCLWKQIFQTLSQENIRPYVNIQFEDIISPLPYKFA